MPTPRPRPRRPAPCPASARRRWVAPTCSTGSGRSWRRRRANRRVPPEFPSVLSWRAVLPSAIISPSCPGPTAAADGCDAMTDPQALREALFDLRTPLRLVRHGGTVGLAERPDEVLAGFVPALLPENLGDPSFRADHRLRYPYAAGAMANGIA